MPLGPTLLSDARIARLRPHRLLPTVIFASSLLAAFLVSGGARRARQLPRLLPRRPAGDVRDRDPGIDLAAAGQVILTPA
jgi:hypothetical protein